MLNSFYLPLDAAFGDRHGEIIPALQAGHCFKSRQHHDELFPGLVDLKHLIETVFEDIGKLIEGDHVFRELVCGKQDIPPHRVTTFDAHV